MPNFGISPEITSTSFQLGVKVNENATLYYVILPLGSPAPSKNLIKQGKDGEGNEALKSGNVVLKADELKEIVFIGLTEDTKYELHLFIEDEYGNSANTHHFDVETNSTSSE